MSKPSSTRLSRATGHKLRASYRLVELPLLLRGAEYSQSELTAIYEIDRKTLKADLEVIAEYWPLIEEKRGRFRYYSIDADAEPVLKKIGARKRRK